MRYFYLLCLLAIVFSPLTVLADDQDLGPAIYLNSPPDQVQTTNEWDDEAETDADSPALAASNSNSDDNVFSVESATPAVKKHTAVVEKKTFLWSYQ